MMSNELQTVLDEILENKNTNLKPENLKAGVTCLGVEGELDGGIDTSDATAISMDIRKDKTAYINGEKVVGELRTEGTSSYAPTMFGNITTGKFDGEDVIQFTTSRGGSGIDVIVTGGSQIEGNIAQSDIADAIGLTGDKIMKGNTVLGVNGVVETNTNDMKLFTSLADAEANESELKPGDIAVILDTIDYPFVLGKHRENICRKNGYYVTPNSGVADFLYPREQFVLDTPKNYTDSVEYKTTSSGKTTTRSITITIDESECDVQMNVSGLSTVHTVYTSNDGLTYNFVEMYYMNGDTKNVYETPRLNNVFTDAAYSLYDEAAKKYDSFSILNDVFYRKAPYGFSGMWFVDVYDSPTEDCIYTMDLTKGLGATYSSTGYYSPSKTSVNLTSILPILKSMTYSSTSDGQPTVTVCVTDEYYYAGTCLGLIYSIAEDKLYLYAYNNDARSCNRYNRSTNENSTLSPIKTIYEAGETTPIYIHAELPKTALCIDFKGTFSSNQLTGVDSISENGTDLYPYNTTLGSNIIKGEWTYLRQYGKKVINKNDFGSFVTADSIPKYMSVITNEGFTTGTKLAPEITKEEEDQTIEILSEVIGGEE